MRRSELSRSDLVSCLATSIRWASSARSRHLPATAPVRSTTALAWLRACATSASHCARSAAEEILRIHRSAEQLRQLSEEVNRIATMLARLSAGPDQSPRPVIKSDDRDVPPVSVETVRRVIRARRLRSRYFPEDLFADPAWDMLLDLLQAELSHLRVPVSSLCIAAAVPATTALRWLKTMVADGLFVRRSDPPRRPPRVRGARAGHEDRAQPLFCGGRAGRGDLTVAAAPRPWHENAAGG